MILPASVAATADNYVAILSVGSFQISPTPSASDDSVLSEPLVLNTSPTTSDNQACFSHSSKDRENGPAADPLPCYNTASHQAAREASHEELINLIDGVNLQLVELILIGETALKMSQATPDPHPFGLKNSTVILRCDLQPDGFPQP